jgi:hypothetical protein
VHDGTRWRCLLVWQGVAGQWETLSRTIGGALEHINRAGERFLLEDDASLQRLCDEHATYRGRNVFAVINRGVGPEV